MSGEDIDVSCADTGVPYGQVNGFVAGPKPAPNLENSYYPNPNRDNSPFADDTNGVIIQDPSNAVFQRTGNYPLIPTTYQYLQQPPAFIYAPGIQSPQAALRHGWSQSYVPEPGMHGLLDIVIPNLILSQPIVSDTVQNAIDKTRSITQPKHKTVRGKAPAAHTFESRG